MLKMHVYFKTCHCQRHLQEDYGIDCFHKLCTIKNTFLECQFFFYVALYLQFKGQLGFGKSVKFLSKPTELSSSLLPGKVICVSVGENTCAAVTGMLKWCCTLLTLVNI